MATTTQQTMTAKLEASGIPFKTINVYGNQIVVTAWSHDAATKWASLAARFAKVRCIIESVDENKTQTGSRLVERHRVWRMFAAI